MSKKVVVLGTGVSGLTSAVSLLKAGYKDVTVIGKFIPGDLNVGYTSPWAGASILSFASSNDTRLQEIDADTLKVFKQLADNVPESGVIYCPGVQLLEDDDEPGEDPLWVRKIYPKFQMIPQDKLPKGVKKGYTFETFTLSAPNYLVWLKGQLEQLGGRLIRESSFGSLQEVIDKYQCDLLINCSGNGAASLSDVKDTNMYTLRGQTVLVRAPHIRTQLYREGKEHITYIIPRGDGTVICGGTMDPNNHSLVADEPLSKDILNRCYQLHPELTHHKGPEAFDIVSVNVGFRPSRKGGIRIEKETKVGKNGKRVTVVHNYGHSSHGYQSSWGCAQRLVKLVNDTSLSAKL